MIGFRLMVVRVVGFDPRCGPARPSLARSGPRAPGAPAHLMRPPPPDPFVSFDFSRAVTSLSLFHLSLSPRGALGFGVEIAGVWIPGGEFFPSPSLFSLSSPSPSSSPMRPPCSRAPRALAPHRPSVLVPCAAHRFSRSRPPVSRPAPPSVARSCPPAAMPCRPGVPVPPRRAPPLPAPFPGLGPARRAAPVPRAGEPGHALPAPSLRAPAAAPAPAEPLPRRAPRPAPWPRAGGRVACPVPRALAAPSAAPLSAPVPQLLASRVPHGSRAFVTLNVLSRMRP
jgi:hypothetical protein